MKTTLYSILSAAVRVAALIMLARTVSGLVAYFASADAVVGPQRWAMAIWNALFFVPAR